MALGECSCTPDWPFYQIFDIFIQLKEGDAAPSGGQSMPWHGGQLGGVFQALSGLAFWPGGERI